MVAATLNGAGGRLADDKPQRRGSRGAARVQKGADAAALAERLAFERLLVELSARFARVSGDAIVAEIEAALAALVRFFGYDRCSFGEFASDGSLNVVGSAAAPGIQPGIRGAFPAELTWFLAEARAGRIIVLPSLPKGLPPEAVAEAAYCRRTGLRSNLSIPLSVGGRVRGLLAFSGFRRARAWPDDLITRLTIIGDVFASAMARARADEELQQLRSRVWHADRVARAGALTAAIAHELNQPLAAILGNAQAGLNYLDRGRAAPDDLRAVLEAIVRDDKRAADTIRTMRAYLRRGGVTHTRIDLCAVLADVLQMLASELRRQGVRVESRFAGACWVAADKVQIEQVALNLILNAATAMQAYPRDERVLQLSVSDGEDGEIEVAVRDSGPGIAAEHLDSVFEPFWTTGGEGLGLGLAICRSIVEAHGGSIRAETNPDRGATFRFRLARDGAKGEPQPEATALAARAAGLGTPNAGAEPVVCVVDDDASIRESLARLLVADGCRVEAYASAQAFLERRSTGDVACLVLDLRMPGMSGVELHERLTAMGDAPPVVFVTGEGDIATSVDAMKLGAVDFLEKPVEGDVLVAAVRSARERRAAERGHAREREQCRIRVGRLSAREREVTAHVIRGRLNKQIAADLGISEQTVKQHRGRVMQKLEVGSVPDLVRVCEASGLFPPGSIPQAGTGPLPDRDGPPAGAGIPPR